MSRHVLALLAALALDPLPLAAAGPDPTAILDAGRPLAPDEERAFLRRYFLEYFRAWSPGAAPFDIGAAAPFYRQDDRLFAFDVFPPVEGFAGWPAYAAGLGAIMGNAAEFSVAPDPDSLRYGRNGDVVWTSMLFRATGRLRDGTPIGLPGRTTLVLEREGDRWLIVHEHVSTPLNGGAAPR